MTNGTSKKPVASVSLDLDNKWSYMKTHGDPNWKSLPSYLPVVVPRVLKFLADRKLTITFFIVGLDADQPGDKEVLRSIAESGHEIGNHSYFHEPWLHLYEPWRIDEEIARAEEAIAGTTGKRPIGFRGPGYSLSQNVLETLANRGYQYDCSTFPTYLGPLARLYYFATAKLTPEEKEQRRKLFGTWGDGRRPLRPYRWRLPDRELLEIPVTTLPLLKAPIHLSYILYLSQISPALARSFFRFAVSVCRATKTPMSLLLHPLDFLGKEDAPELSFFPAMGMPAEKKLAIASDVLEALAAAFRPVPMVGHADALTNGSTPPLRLPDFATL
jgi:peptidoglycan/xylan/chitin deacetylase (PgdA/CDA1 family)